MTIHARRPHRVARRRNHLFAMEHLEGRRLLAADPITGHSASEADYAPEFTGGPADDAEVIQPTGIVIVSPNLWVIDAYLTDNDGNQLTAPAVGSRVYLEARFGTRDLPASCSGSSCYFTLQYSIDGVNRTSAPLTWGIGQSGTRYWIGRLGDWIVTPGNHTAQVRLDSPNRIFEISDTDNYSSFQFSPVTFQSAYGETKFVAPLGGTNNFDWSIVNYTDMVSGSGVADYRGGNHAYNGHDALDITVSNFDIMERGIPILAAASGVVEDRRDGGFDRNTCPSICNMVDNWGNYVVVDHGNGWKTRYIHHREDSVLVDTGDFVKAGDPIAIMGSSGNSSDAHLHFAVRHQGLVVETYYEPFAYWYSPLPYAGDTPGALDYGTTNFDPTVAQLKEGPAKQNVFRVGEDNSVRLWTNIHAIKQGDTISFQWIRPNGTTAATRNYTMNATLYGWVEDALNISSSSSLGRWTVRLLHNNNVLVDHDFDITSSSAAAESAIEFETANHYASEREGSATVTVRRTGHSSTAMTVNYITLSQTASPGTDYQTRSGTLTFLPGQRERTIMVPLVDDASREGTERFLLMLTDPTGGGYLGPQWLTGINLLDNDALITYNRTDKRFTARTGVATIADSVLVSMSGTNILLDVNEEVFSFPLQLTDEIRIRTNAGNDTIHVEETALTVTYDVDAGTGNDTVRVGEYLGSLLGHTLDEIRGTVEVNGGGGNDSLTVTDLSLFSDGGTYRILPNKVERRDPIIISTSLPNSGDDAAASATSTQNGAANLTIVKTVQYQDIDTLEFWGTLGEDSVTVNAPSANTFINTSSGNDMITVEATASGKTLSIDGSFDDDSFAVIDNGYSGGLTLIGGDSATRSGDVTTVQGDGTNIGRYLPHASTVGSGLMTLDGQGLNFSQMEKNEIVDFATLLVTTPNSADRLSISDTGGNQHMFEGTSGGIPVTPLAFSGIGQLTLNTRLVESASVQDQLLLLAGNLPTDGTQTLIYEGGIGSNFIAINSGEANLDVNTVAGGSNDVYLENGSSVNFVDSQYLNSLTLNTTAFASLAPGGDKALVTKLLNIAGGASPQATIDIHDNGLIIDYNDVGPSPLALHEAQILHSRDDHLPTLWTGTGITSHLAMTTPNGFTVSAKEADDVFGTAGGTFFGVTLDPGSRAVLIAVESLLSADFNGDGVVDAADAQVLFSSWGATSGEADLNGDGIVDAADASALFSQWTG